MNARRRLPNSLFALLAMAMWLAGSPVHAQTLWNDIQVGTSLRTIEHRFPAAARPASPTSLGDGSRELLRLSNVTAQGHSFHALFFFKQNKLTQVSLELQEKGGAIFALQTFRDMKGAFEAKYGAPDGEQDQNFNAPNGTGTFRSASWRSERTLITLSYAVAAGELVVLNVAYRLAAERKTDDI
ncbi:hypothetical protein [Lysobacter sp. 22409]|uniref:hypothetical protein n=1 Tax=Lysobacter sp. 22409 TaxID=3453917 RepID=UPI003F870B75